MIKIGNLLACTRDYNQADAKSESNQLTKTNELPLELEQINDEQVSSEGKDGTSALNMIPAACVETNRPNSTPYEVHTTATMENTQNVIHELSDDDIEIVGEIERFPKGEKLTIRIIAVESPIRFWFQYEEKTLRKLMKEMNQTYSALKCGQLILDRDDLSKLKYVAVDFLGIWHRASVNSVPDINGNVAVTFIDYGTNTNLHISNCRYLLQKYSRRAAQAIQGKLNGVRSNEGGWTTHSIEKFRKHVTKKYVDCSVVGYCKQQNIVEMKIHVESVSIGEQMIKDGIASVCHEPCI